VIENIWWTTAWAIAGGAPAFSWTISVNGIGDRDVLAEVALAKVVIPPGGGHAKAAIGGATWSDLPNQRAASTTWSINDTPARWISRASYLQYAIEVSGSGTYAWMVAKLYFFV
jgi:hypothetical protein